MQGSITEHFKRPWGGHGQQTNSLLNGAEIEAECSKGKRLYLYSKTRADRKDWSEMTPQEVVEWWID